MDALASISGLATGIDFRGLVDQIIEVESERLDYLRVGITRASSQQDAWGEARALLQTLRDAGDALRGGTGLSSFLTSVQGGSPGLLAVTADATAAPGVHRVRILERAQTASLGSGLQPSRSSAMGLQGTVVVGGVAVDVDTGDSLQDIASAINASNAGSSPSGVSASIVGAGGAYRMVLHASEGGREGLDVRDVSGILGSLGLLDGTDVLKHRTSGGFDGDLFADSSTAVGDLLGFTGPPPTGTVTLGAGASAFTVSLDLSALSLDGVRDQINASAAAAGSSMRAIVEEVGSGDEARYRISIDGTAAAADDGGVLSALGIVEGGRGAVQHRLHGDVLSAGAPGSPASEASLLTDLLDGSQSAGVSVGDTMLFQGRAHDGTAFSFSHTIQAGDTLGTLATRLEGAEGFDGTALVTVSAEGRFEVTATEGGASQLTLSAFAGNEGGGLLDLGTFEVADEGRRRELTEGRDARVEIDGFLVSSTSNQITDVLPGLSLDLLGADPGVELEVGVTRDIEAGVEALRAFVDAFNAVTAYADRGLGVIGDARPPLAGDSVLRSARQQLRGALETVLADGAPGAPRRLADIGISVTRDGSYAFDEAAAEEALRSGASDVLRIFGAVSGEGPPPAIGTPEAGVGGAVLDVLDRLLGSGGGSIDSLLDRIEEGSMRLEDRLFQREQRLDDRRARLLAQFSALEGAMARAQAQSERIAAQLASLPGAADR